MRRKLLSIAAAFSLLLCTATLALWVRSYWICDSLEWVSRHRTRFVACKGGRVLLQGKPADLIAQLEGKVWRKTVRKDDVARYRDSHTVLSTRLFGGETRVHVLSDQRPDEGFEPIPADLEDVYFTTMAGHVEEEPVPEAAR